MKISPRQEKTIVKIHIDGVCANVYLKHLFSKFLLL